MKCVTNLYVSRMWKWREANFTHFHPLTPTLFFFQYLQTITHTQKKQTGNVLHFSIFGGYFVNNFPNRDQNVYFSIAGLSIFIYLCFSNLSLFFVLPHQGMWKLLSAIDSHSWEKAVSNDSERSFHALVWFYNLRRLITVNRHAISQITLPNETLMYKIQFR